MLLRGRYRTCAWIVLIGAIHFASAMSVRAEDRITYLDHVRPIFASNCLSCHNPDKREAGLDLSNYRGAMAGGSSGKVLAPGNANSSRLFLLISHQEEPAMPPNQAPIANDSLELVRDWITQGCRDTKDSAAQTPKQSTVAFEFDSADQAAVTTAYPHAFRKRPFVPSAQRGAINALTVHPGVDWVALAGQNQVLAYDVRNLELLGVLPFKNGMPRVVRFSRSGRLLLAAGGVGATSGDVRLWNAETGEFVGTFGEAYDEVLAADLDASQQRIASGGPAGVVKVHATRSGELLNRNEKHTDWITAVAYSPDGILLATADRAGGLFVWEAESHAEFYMLKGHATAITDMSWRADSNVLATCDESGHVFLWEMHGGKEIKRWKAHEGGALCVAFARDGRIVTGGRDRYVRWWDGNGGKLRDLPAMDDIVVDADVNAAGTRIIAADLNGVVRVFNAEDGAAVGDLRANPPSFDEQRAAAQAAFEAADAALVEKQAALATAQQAAATALTQYDAANQTHEQAKTATVAAEQALQQADTNLVAAETAMAALGDGDASVASDLAATRGSLASARSSARAALDHAKAAVTKAAQRRDELSSQRDRTAQAASAAAPAVEAATSQREAAQAQLAKWAAGDLEPEIDTARGAAAAAQAAYDEAIAARDQVRNQLVAARTELSSARAMQALFPETMDQRARDMEAARQRVAQMQAQSTQVQERLVSLKAEQTALAESIQRLTKMSANVEAENTLPAALAKTQEALALIEAELQRTQANVDTTNNELAAANAALTAAQAAIAQATEKRDALPQLIASGEAAVAAAEKAASEADAAAMERETALEAATRALDALVQQRDEQLRVWVAWREKVVK